MLYTELFKSMESVRWNMATDIPWQDFDRSKLTDEQAQTIKMNAITEWAALPATEMFLRDNRDDSDFSAFMSVWFFEEQKHSLVLIEYLRRFAPDLVPTEEELHRVRFEFDPAPPLETLMLHFCGEVRLNHWYRRASDWHTEPVIKEIYKVIAQDEARHAGAYLRYMKRALTQRGQEIGAQARMAFAKTRQNHLLLIAVDGRSARAQGINAEELTDLLLQLNATDAINMDGGGSLTMFVRGASPTGVVNYPSDLRKKDPNLFEHYGQRKNGAALLVKPKSAAARARVRKIKVAADPEAKDYIDVKH
jgi:hypothetical protein